MERYNKYLSCFTLLLSVLFFLGCGPQSNQESDLNWGHFRDPNHMRLVTLLNLPPQSKVCVSGFKAEKAIWAINQWSTAAGRQNHLKAENCFNEAGAKSIRIVGPDNASCGPGVAGQTDTVHEVKICQHAPEQIMDHTFLHEIGHMWGLCDQYNGGVNCQGGTVNPNTVMGAAFGLQALTADDIEGIRAITQSDTFPANQAWKTIQSETLSSSVGATPNPLQQPTPPPPPPLPTQPAQPGQIIKACVNMGSFYLCEG